LSRATPRSRYNAFNRYLRRRYGGPVRKIPLDGGFGCPHRGGRDGRQAGGCIYCENAAFSPASAPNPPPLLEQVRRGIRRAVRRDGTGPRAFIAYFQAYTGTWGDPALLRERYGAVRAFPQVRGLAVATRPDCVGEPVLDVLSSCSDEGYEVWLELGLQSASEDTLRRINRGHGVEAFVRAVERAAARPVLLCAHVILGLPGEGPDEMRDTARLLAGLPVHGVKIHHCHVIRGTPLELEFRRGRYRPLDRAGYLGAVCDFLEETPWPVTVHRLVGEAPDALLVAPRWEGTKASFVQDVERELARRGSVQGARAGRGLPAAPAAPVEKVPRLG